MRVLEEEAIGLRSQPQQAGPEFEMHLRGVWEQEWRQREIHIEEFWRNLLEEKEREWSTKGVKVEGIAPQAEAELRAVWQQQQEEEWKVRVIEIETYWQNVLHEKEQEWIRVENTLHEKHQLQIREIQQHHTHTHTHSNTHETVVIKEERERWEKEKEVIILNAIRTETAQLHSTIDEQVRYISNLEGEREKWEEVRRGLEE